MAENEIAAPLKDKKNIWAFIHRSGHNLKEWNNTETMLHSYLARHIISPYVLQLRVLL